MFVFEGANRIVVEKPCYGHATYFFDLEEPLPVSAQVCQFTPPNSKIKTCCMQLGVCQHLFLLSFDSLRLQSYSSYACYMADRLHMPCCALV